MVNTKLTLVPSCHCTIKVTLRGLVYAKTEEARTGGAIEYNQEQTVLRNHMFRETQIYNKWRLKITSVVDAAKSVC